MTLRIHQFPCFTDNYGFLVRDETSGRVAAIDTPEPARIERELANLGWRLDLILNTHWHPDHTGGNLVLKDRWACEIIGPRNEADRIPGLDRAVGEGDHVELGRSLARVHDTPGHTRGHIIFHFLQDGCAFVGDTIFALGCGRLFEGSPDQMWASLTLIAGFDPDTVLYCAHEYTEANSRFALSVDNQNPALKARSETILALRRMGLPTVPTTVRDECATNPFLRAGNAELQGRLGMEGATPVATFAALRNRKDRF